MKKEFGKIRQETPLVIPMELMDQIPVEMRATTLIMQIASIGLKTD